MTGPCQREGVNAFGIFFSFLLFFFFSSFFLLLFFLSFFFTLNFVCL